MRKERCAQISNDDWLIYLDEVRFVDSLWPVKTELEKRPSTKQCFFRGDFSRLVDILLLFKILDYVVQPKLKSISRFQMPVLC